MLVKEKYVNYRVKYNIVPIKKLMRERKDFRLRGRVSIIPSYGQITLENCNKIYCKSSIYRFKSDLVFLRISFPKIQLVYI